MDKKYTVLGVYEDTGETFAHFVTAKDVYAAIEEAAKYAEYNDSLVIIGAVSRFQLLMTPGADNTTSVYASSYEREE